MNFDARVDPGPNQVAVPMHHSKPLPIAYWTPRFIFFKRLCDICFCLVAIPLILCVCLALLILNPFFNHGPVFYRQERMGMGRKKIMLWKFRTMEACERGIRDHDAPLEHHRITRLGRYLRKSRIDELPNFINVLRGEMSLVGPRPEAWNHALAFLDDIPRYHNRFRVRPGITGLAQVRGGYADDRRATRRKARLDYYYVSRSRIKLDLYIIFLTIAVMVTGLGAR